MRQGIGSWIGKVERSNLGSERKRGLRKGLKCKRRTKSNVYARVFERDGGIDRDWRAVVSQREFSRESIVANQLALLGEENAARRFDTASECKSLSKIRRIESVQRI